MAARYAVYIICAFVCLLVSAGSTRGSNSDSIALESRLHSVAEEDGFSYLSDKIASTGGSLSSHRRRLTWTSGGVASKNVIETAAIPDRAAELAEGIEGLQPQNPLKFSVTIITAPQPLIGLAGERQKRAILSWRRLVPTPRIVLIGNHPSFYALKSEVRHMSVEHTVDSSYAGVPLFNSLIARAHAVATTHSMLIASDVVLLQDTMTAVQRTFEEMAGKNHVIVAAASEVPRFPRGLMDSTDILKSKVNESGVRAFLSKRMTRSPGAKVGFWAWDFGNTPLINSSMPPFLYRRGKHDHWLAHEIVTAGQRPLVDVSDVVTAFAVAQGQRGQGRRGGAGRAVVPPEDPGADSGKGGADAEGVDHESDSTDTEDESDSDTLRDRRAAVWDRREPQDMEVWVNQRLVAQYAAAVKGKGKGGSGPSPSLITPLRLDRKVTGRTKTKPSGVATFSLKEVRCAYESPIPSSDYAYDTTDPATNQEWICNQISLAGPKSRWSKEMATAGPPNTSLKDLLPHVANDRKILTLVAVSHLYRDMLMSFICNLRRLGLPPPLVAALDPEVYRFGLEMGLAVFYDPKIQFQGLGSSGFNSSLCAYDTQCFRSITKLKSRIVLQVLQLGYSVLWSDVDIIWYRDPLPQFEATGPGTFPVQSDMPSVSQPDNGANGTVVLGGAINSGFYFARAEPKVMEAFKAIIAHGITTNSTEQPSFYAVLCGEGGVSTEGNSECLWQKNGLRTIFLSRKLHPNGKVFSLWRRHNTVLKCLEMGCSTLHNNWIFGRNNKSRRAKEKGLWYYDEGTRMCMYPWYKRAKGWRMRIQEVLVMETRARASNATTDLISNINVTVSS